MATCMTLRAGTDILFLTQS